MGEFFGTDGIRGEAGKYPLDEKTIEWIGYSLAEQLASKLQSPPRIVIGRDTRESGVWIEAAIARGIATSGARAHFAGIITTPGVAYLTRYLKADAGIVISASHNPYDDNGIKIFAPSGQKLDDATELAIEADLKAGAPSFPKIQPATVEIDRELKAAYVSYLKHEAGAGLNLNGLKIVIDCANGASSDIAPELFSSLGANVTVINASPDGRNINLDCGSLHPELVQKMVLDTGSNLGLACDVDADRLIMVDDLGNLVDGDQILFVIAQYLYARGELDGARVVATVMSNLGLELALKSSGISLARTAVGDKNVLDELIKGGGSIGGEQSGHIIFPKISFAGDGMLSAIEVLRVAADSGRTLSQLTAGMKRLPQLIINVKVSSKPPLDSIPEITDSINSLEAELAGKGRLLVRYSGTENKLRIMIEGEDQDVIQRQAESLAEVVRRSIENKITKQTK